VGRTSAGALENPFGEHLGREIARWDESDPPALCRQRRSSGVDATRHRATITGTASSRRSNAIHSSYHGRGDAPQDVSRKRSYPGDSVRVPVGDAPGISGALPIGVFDDHHVTHTDCRG